MSKAKLKKIISLAKKEFYYKEEGGSYARKCGQRK